MTIKPPTTGDRCFIRKTFEGWSPGTLVVIDECNDGAHAVVTHEPTKTTFTVPVEFLVRKRDRSCSR